MTELNVEAHGETIIVTEPETGFYAIYEKRGDAPQLILKQRADTKDHVLLARVWHVAVEKARELGWIVLGGRASDRFKLLSQNIYKLDTLMATTGRNIVVALPYAKRVTSGMTCLRTKWVMDLFKSPRQKLDPLDMEILERAFT